jgi:GNAT superfamily N-acetyltransferase
MAFGSTLAREEAFTDDVWHGRAAGAASGAERVTFIAERDGQWIGLASGLAADPDEPEPDNAEPLLVGMFVESADRGRGVGVALVGAVVAWARTRGATSLYLWVTATNDSAIGLYDKCGFRRTGEQKPLEHSPSLSEVRMVRDLR